MSDTPRTNAEAQTCMDTSSEWHGEWVRLDFARQLERELTDAKHRIRSLIEERDSARIQADHKWKLREEFKALLGTSDVAEGVKRVKEMQGRQEVIHALMKALRRMIDAVEGDRMKNAIQAGKDLL